MPRMCYLTLLLIKQSTCEEQSSETAGQKDIGGESDEEKQRGGV